VLALALALEEAHHLNKCQIWLVPLPQRYEDMNPGGIGSLQDLVLNPYDLHETMHFCCNYFLQILVIRDRDERILHVCQQQPL